MNSYNNKNKNFSHHDHENLKPIEENKVLDFITKNYGATFLDIARGLKIHFSLNNKLTNLLRKLCDEKKIDVLKNQGYYALKFVKEDVFTISITAKRLGFIDFEQNEDGSFKSAFLYSDQLKNVLDKDEVLAKIYSYINDKDETLYKASIINVVKHTITKIVGIFSLSYKGKRQFVALDERNKTNFLISNLEKLNHSQIKNNYDVVSCIVVQPSPDKHNSKDYVELVFDKKIATLDDKDYVVKKIMTTNSVNETFSDELTEAIKEIPKFVSDKEISERKNLIDLPTVTIDGLDTKDFDDAISCYKKGDIYKLFIHIADVSYYVKENSPIDNEALLRGTSIYLPTKVIPMLPFELSNGICSLNPNEIRCCITLELDIDKKGNNIAQDIYPSVIKSNYRLTYNEVNDYYEGKITTIPDDIKNNLNDAKDLSKIILDKKINEGYVDFEIEEAKIIMENETTVKDIVIRKDGISEKLIEAFMIRANETVAKMMFDKGYPSIYRVHDKPSPDKLLMLQDLIKFSHYKDINVPFDGEPKSFQIMVQKLKEQSFNDFIKSALLRTMQKAIYSSKNIGHFGLASKEYSHFTSPIRRYPDLLIHRLIRKFIFEKKYKEDKYEEELDNITRISALNSEAEKNAMQVERDVVDFWKSNFFEKFINKTFDAMAISVEKFGIFFNIDEYQTSVLVRFDSIIEDSVSAISQFEAKGNKLNIRVGKIYKILIESIDKDKGKINAKLVI